MPHFETKHIFAYSEGSKIHQNFSHDLSFIFKDDTESDFKKASVFICWF